MGKKKKSKASKDGEEGDPEKKEETQILGTDGKPIDPSSISVMTGTTYDQEFAFELEKLKKGGHTKSVPWGSTVRAPPEILHGYSAPIVPKNASGRLDLRATSRSDKFCK